MAAAAGACIVLGTIGANDATSPVDDGDDITGEVKVLIDKN